MTVSPEKKGVDVSGAHECVQSDPDFVMEMEKSGSGARGELPGMVAIACKGDRRGHFAMMRRAHPAVKPDSIRPPPSSRPANRAPRRPAPPPTLSPPPRSVGWRSEERPEGNELVRTR